jgi:hypothetical protein
VALSQARSSTKPLWGFTSRNPYHSQSRAEQRGYLFGKVYVLSMLNINDTISREGHKTIYSRLRITGKALFNQSKLPAFVSPRQVN